MKRILLLILLALNFQANSQNLYDMRWTNEGVEYYGFMVFFSEENVYMRIGYYSGEAWTVVESQYLYEVGEDGEIITMVATASEFLQNENGDTWDPDHIFWYIDEETKDWAGPYLITDSELAAENYDNIQESEFTEVDVKTLTEEYLKFFYWDTDHDYQVFMAEASGVEADVTDTYEDVETDGYEDNSGNTTEDPNPASESTSSGDVTLHIMVVANTSISDIGPSTLVDVNNILNEFAGIVEVLGIKMNKKVISDDQFTKSNVTQYLQAFDPGANDIVVFLYSGHGYRYSDQTEKFPQMDLRSNEYQHITDETTYNVKEIYDMIVAKGARLNIVLGDCCNSDIGFSRKAGTGFLSSRSTVNADDDKLAKLFINSKGGICAAGASKGEYSWCSMNNGGFFTASFIGSLREEVSKFNPEDVATWNDIMVNTVKGTRNKSDMCSGCEPKQNVVYENHVTN